MKTLALLNSYSQGLSGGDKLFLDYAVNLTGKNNHKLTIITSKLGRNLCQKHHINADYVITSLENQFSHPVYTYTKRVVSSIIQLINKNFSFVHSSSDFLPDVLPAFFLKVKDPKCFWEQKIYHLIPKTRPLSYINQRISFYLIKLKADKIIVDNQSLKQELQGHHSFPQTKVFLQIPQINISLINQSLPSKKVYTAVFLGQLRKSKGIFDLVDIWRQVVKTYPKAVLAIIGQDINRNKEKLTKLISQHNLDKNIKILGFLPPQEVFGTIKSSGLLLLPSYEEGYGLVVDEAIACQARVVAYDLPVFRERFTQNKIHTVPQGNTKIFSQKVMELINR
ncbi:MAG: glycosyltransferase family 4 protein [Patescibacteria group bacterium]|jgi:glycosyltransferase involved in cell wall biosynthesis